MIKYISIIKDSDKGLFRYMKKYSNNFSLLSRTITPKPGIKDQFYRSQKDKKKSVSFQWNEKKREREKINLAEGVFIVVLEQWGKKRKVDRLKAGRAKEIKLTFVHSFSEHAKTLNWLREDRTGNKLM